MDALDAPRLPRRRPPRLAVALELGRALGNTALLPLRLADFAVCRDALAAEVRGDIAGAVAEPWTPPQDLALPQRRLRVFVSCAEASGEIHAVGVTRALTARLAAAGAPQPELVGLGGEALRAAGVRTVADPVARATMGLRGALQALPYYLGLVERCAQELVGCDLALMVDSPALHVPLGRIARRAGARVVQFVAPQHWGWAPWRAAGLRSAVDRVLTILPFEPAWFARRGIDTVHVGHPLLDALPRHVPAPQDPGRTALALLPGSRSSVIDHNLPWMLAVLRRVRQRLGDAEVLLPHPPGSPHVERLRGHLAAAGASSWVRLVPGALHDTLGRSRAAFSVSGTVLMDLLHQRLPAVVVYGLGNELSRRLATQVLVPPWFAGPNLLAGREVLPEFTFSGERRQAEVGAALERCYNDEVWRARCRAGLELAARRQGPPGACDRAAAAALELVSPARTAPAPALP
jgi:lipid-A-disaccharide synthase